jgi:hypothetical protein
MAIKFFVAGLTCKVDGLLLKKSCNAGWIVLRENIVLKTFLMKFIPE